MSAAVAPVKDFVLDFFGRPVKVGTVVVYAALYLDSTVLREAEVTKITERGLHICRPDNLLYDQRADPVPIEYRIYGIRPMPRLNTVLRHPDRVFATDTPTDQFWREREQEWLSYHRNKPVPQQ